MKHRGGVLIASGYRLAQGEDPDPDPPPGDSPPGSIDATGVTNVSAELQAWIDSKPDGSSLVFTGRTYRVDQQLNLWSRNNLTLTGGTFLTDDPTGDGSTYAAPSSAARGRSFWDLRACTNITISGMTLEGPHTAGGTYVLELEAQMGFNILGSTSVDIGFCNISNVYGDFAYWGLGVTGLWNDDVHVHDCICDGNGRQGFALVAARNCSMVNNTLTRMARAFVDLEPNGAALFGCDNILIEDNTVDFHNLAFIASGGVGPVDNITVRNNTGTGLCNISSIVRGSAGSRTNWIFDGNTSVSPQSSGGGYFLELTFMENVTVINNVQPVDSGPMALAYYDHCTGVINQGNTVAGGTWTYLNNESTRIRDCGNRLTASGPFDQPIACVTNFGTALQYAGLTAWYDAFQATDADLAASDMTDFSGNARHLTSSGAARPTFRHSISGKGMKCYQFDGADDYVGNTIPLSNYLTNSAYTIFVVFEAITIGSAADNDAVWSDSAGVHGIYMRSVPDAYGYNLDSGGADTVTKPLTLNDRTLLMMRHEGGNLYVSKDGAAETSVASGNTTTLAGLVRVGANYLGNQFSNILAHELNVYNVALTTAQILDRTTRLILDWGVDYHYGCVDTFTRANGLLGTSEAGGKVWLNSRPSTITEWSVVSGKAMCTVGDPVSGENVTYLDAGLSDYTLTVEVDAALGGSVVFRYANAPNWSIFLFGGGGGYLNKVVDATWTQVGSIVFGLPTSGTHTIKVVLLGSSVKTYIDTTLVHDVTITAQQTATQCGLRCGTDVVSFNQTYDNFLVVP